MQFKSLRGRTAPARVARGRGAVVEVLEVRRFLHGNGAPQDDAVNVAAALPLTFVPKVSIVATDRVAGEEGPDTATFRVSRDGDTSQPLPLKFVVGGTATNGVDYGVIREFAIPAGQATVSFLVRPVADAKLESRESVTVTLAPDGAYAVAAGAGAATIVLHDRPQPVVAIEAVDRVASEVGRNTGRFSFTRIGGDLSQPLEVNFVVGGTATNGVDYGVVGPAITIPAGATSFAFNVTPIGDTKVEPRESITLTLAPNTGRFTPDPTRPAATMVIHDATAAVLADIGYFSANVNFQPYAALPPPRYVVDGGATFKRHPSGFRYGWNRSKTDTTTERHSPRAYDQRYDTFNTMEAGDEWSIAVPNGTYLVHVVAGDPESFGNHIRIVVEGELVIDGTTTSANRVADKTRAVAVEDGILTIRSGNGGAVNNKLLFVNVTQLSDALGRTMGRPLVTLSDSHADASEPSDDGETELLRTGPTDQPLTVGYAVAGTATAGADYEPLTGTITFAAGADRATLAVAVLNDPLEESTETVTIQLLPGPGYVVDGDIDGAYLLFDND